MVELEWVKLGWVVKACNEAGLYFSLEYNPEGETFSLYATTPGSDDYCISESKPFNQVIDDFLVWFKSWNNKKSA